ncbi:RNA-directed DNA polymerase, eukaryota [Tanacetum coccineum]
MVSPTNRKRTLKSDLADLSPIIDKGDGDIEVVDKKTNVFKSLQELEKLQSLEVAQKGKIKWAIEGDENSKYYHGILNKKISQLAIRGILVNGVWIDSPILVKRSNSSFITLIPKTPDANMVKDFRPISLIGSMYKIIAKILANRLVFVLGDLVNEVQFAFVVDRQILDGPFILNEIIQWCRSKKKQSLVFKVDFEKAFNSVRWDYLDDILRRFGFGKKWCSWIQSFLRSSRGLVIVNGSPTEEFQFHKGLKQGDPLSPFLFILVMESLHISFQRVVDAGLHINMSKSKLIGIYVDAKKVSQAARKIGCDTFKTPFTYLGSKVGGHMSRIQSWNETIEGMATCLSKWKMKTLSIGDTLFWDETWYGDIAFKILLPRVYALESRKNIDDASKLSDNNLAFSFCRDPRGGVEQEQFESLMAKIIDEFMLSEVASRTRWIKVVPIKVNVLAWKIKLDYLPTRLNISRHGMDIDSILCPMCGKTVESTKHIFFTCHIARDILRMTTSWWDIMYMEISSYEEWLDWILSLRLLIIHKQIFEGVCYVMW